MTANFLLNLVLAHDFQFNDIANNTNYNEKTFVYYYKGTKKHKNIVWLSACFCLKYLSVLLFTLRNGEINITIVVFILIDFADVSHVLLEMDEIWNNCINLVSHGVNIIYKAFHTLCDCFKPFVEVFK